MFQKSHFYLGCTVCSSASRQLHRFRGELGDVSISYWWDINSRTRRYIGRSYVSATAYRMCLDGCYLMWRHPAWARYFQLTVFWLHNIWRFLDFPLSLCSPSCLVMIANWYRTLVCVCAAMRKHTSRNLMTGGGKFRSLAVRRDQTAPTRSWKSLFDCIWNIS